MNNELTPEQQKLADEILAEAEKQIAEIYEAQNYGVRRWPPPPPPPPPAPRPPRFWTLLSFLRALKRLFDKLTRKYFRRKINHKIDVHPKRKTLVSKDTNSNQISSDTQTYVSLRHRNVWIKKKSKFNYQWGLIRGGFNEDPEKIFQKIASESGICNENNPIYQTLEKSDRAAREALSSWLVCSLSYFFPQAVPPCALGAILVIISFEGLKSFCEIYGQDDIN